MPLGLDVFASLIANPCTLPKVKKNLKDAVYAREGIESVRCRTKCDKTGHQCYKWAGHHSRTHNIPTFKYNPNSMADHVRLISPDEDVSTGGIVLYSLLTSGFLDDPKLEDVKIKISRTFVGENGLEGVRCRCSNDEGLMCQRNFGHKKTHLYLLPGMLGRSFFFNLVDSMTDGRIKNLAGLDNIDVSKGFDNFEDMEQLIKDFYGAKGYIDKATEDELVKTNKWVKTFHKVYFSDHLGTTSKHQCACEKCGFHDTDGDPIKCETREKKEHLPSCEDCTKCFEFIGRMFDIHEKIVSGDRARNFTLLEQDGLSRAKSVLKKYQCNLEDYRAHLVQKWWEGIEESYKFKDLKPGECMVICDFKMKILMHLFRESMEKFFSKKGFTCIGFMVVYGSSTGKKNCQFYFGFSEDTKQDGNLVLGVKYHLYNNILPKEGVTIVHFRGDGAQCFSQILMKACSPLWKIWTDGKIDEVSFKISVSGCGKTNLDALFGVMSHAIRSMVRNGASFASALDLFNLFAENPLQASYFFLFAPDRSFQHYIKKTDGGRLKKVLRDMGKDYHLKKEGMGMRGKRHSDLGDGTYFDLEDMMELVGSKEVTLPVEIEDDVEHRDDTNDSDEGNLLVQEESASFVRAPGIHVLKSTYVPPRTRCGTDSDAGHSIMDAAQSYRERVKYKKAGMQQSANVKAEKRVENFRAKQSTSGLYLCDAKNQHGEYCTRVFQSESALEKHRKANKHTWPSVNSHCNYVREFSDVSKVGFKNCLGTRINRDEASRSKATKADNDSVVVFSHPEMDDRWKECGCYNTQRAQTNRFSNSLRNDLEKMFLEGEENVGQKVTPERACDKLKEMIIDGRYKYSPDSDHGDLPSTTQIKSWFCRRSREKGKKKKDKKMTVREMEKELLRLTSKEKITERDSYLMLLSMDGWLPEDHSSLGVKYLKPLLVSRNIFSKPPTKSEVYTKLLTNYKKLEESNVESRNNNNT